MNGFVFHDIISKCTHIIYLQYIGPQKMKAWAYTLLVWCTVGQDHIQVDSGYWWQLKVSAIQSLGFYFLCFDTMGITEWFLRAWPEEVQLEYSLFNQEILLWPLHFILWPIFGVLSPRLEASVDWVCSRHRQGFKLNEFKVVVWIFLPYKLCTFLKMARFYI